MKFGSGDIPNRCAVGTLTVVRQLDSNNNFDVVK